MPVTRACFDKTRFVIHLSPKLRSQASKTVAAAPASPAAGKPAPAPGAAATGEPKEKLTLLYMYASESALETISETGSLKASLSCAGWEQFRWQDVVYDNLRAKKIDDDLTYRKAKDWSYEHEVRCFCEPLEADSAINGMLLYQLPMQFLAGVILGPRSHYATPYMQKKLEQCLKKHERTTGNRPVANGIIPWLLCSRACFHDTEYAFFAHPWFDHFSANRFQVALKIASGLSLLKFPNQKFWSKVHNRAKLTAREKNWGYWADVLSRELGDSDAKVLAEEQNDERFAAHLMSLLAPSAE